MDQEPGKTGKILLYNNGGEKEFVSVVFQDETFWLTQKAMAELFDVKTPAISKHLQILRCSPYLAFCGNPRKYR